MSRSLILMGRADNNLIGALILLTSLSWAGPYDWDTRIKLINLSKQHGLKSLPISISLSSITVRRRQIPKLSKVAVIGILIDLLEGGCNFSPAH